MNDIKSSLDYDRFRILEGNRAVQDVHVQRLEKSILENNLLRYNPIIVNSRLEVLDGQHRLEVARRNNLPIYYVVAEGTSIDDVVRFNINQEKWTFGDYLHSYAQRGYLDYMVLKGFLDNYPMPIGMGIIVVGDGDNKKHNNKFKDGSFKIKNIKASEEFGEIWVKYTKILPKNIYIHKAFTSALYYLHGHRIDHGRMLEKLEMFERHTGKGLTRCNNASEYIRAMEEIYNYRSSSRRVRFF